MTFPIYTNIIFKILPVLLSELVLYQIEAVNQSINFKMVTLNKGDST